MKIDARHFGVTDEEAAALRENLKAKLKPLAALALQLSPTLVGDERLDLLARKLWELDDQRFLLPLARALKIEDSETTEVLYGWIGVSFFQREFAKRQTKLRLLAEWLSKPLFADGMNDDLVRQCDTDRKQVRDRLRWAWSTAGTIFDRYNASYGALIGQGDARPFVDYLQTARADFQGLGVRLSVLEQCLCVYEVGAGQDRGSQLGFEIMQDVARSMRDAPLGAAAGLAA